METMNELIPFAREMLAQRPNRKMVKIYVVGSVLTFFGVVIGLVETVCSPFAAVTEPREQPEVKSKLPTEPSKEPKQLKEVKRQITRNGSYRKHAS
ncbi:G0/G1 switch protein 2 [Scyliorhinus canicula]|uniref:G0/G1 switch protein 2 n=1 Tax=Scyliorhinus canicula TaxID=7830 RepID=UPI0018F4A0D8|nr:G0/G1 switch protein 2 [Scyliorhinus canicula]